jgi:hypothetical protein
MLKFIVGFVLLFIPLFAQAQTFEKTVLIAQPKENESRYFYVPFDVPKNAKSLTVSYEYDKKGGTNVLDLGVFDSRFDGTEMNIKGFRGWSGAEAQFLSVKIQQPMVTSREKSLPEPGALLWGFTKSRSKA